jgi:hypothetical protein
MKENIDISDFFTFTPSKILSIQVKWDTVMNPEAEWSRSGNEREKIERL